jgi:hypothetical protein
MTTQKTGRAYQRGAARPAAKLTDPQIVEIRQAYAHGAKQVEIAAEYGITQPLVSLIVNGKRWTHVGGPIPLTATPEEQE